jgi:hypothetical protein
VFCMPQEWELCITMSKKEEGAREIATSTTSNQVDELAAKFDEFSLVSYIFTNTVTRSSWYLDNGASCHMIEARNLFSNLMEKDLGIHVEIGDDAKYAVKGEGTILFQLELGGLFEAQDVLYVPGLKKNLLSDLVMEDMGFVIMFKTCSRKGKYSYV